MRYAVRALRRETVKRVVRVAGKWRAMVEALRAGGRPSRAVLAGCLLVISFPALAFSPPAELIVVTDDNYPPFLFRTEDGGLQGILKDKWELWSQKAGVPVRLEGMEWAKAQSSVQNGTAHVIDALAHTYARERLYEFSPSYATIEARVFFHHSISGISAVKSMRGFTIGAK